jgi:hypothetical protein
MAFPGGFVMSGMIYGTKNRSDDFGGFAIPGRAFQHERDGEYPVIAQPIYLNTNGR